MPKKPNTKYTKLIAVLNFNTNPGEEVLSKVGISSVDYSGAKNNLVAEM